jgi:hypothetical protein
MNKILEIILMIAAIICMYVVAARGQDHTALHLAQCLRAETDSYSGHNQTEWAATAWVLRKRAYQKGVSLDEMVLLYCALFDRRSARYYGLRSENIRQSTFKDPKHGRKKHWQKLERFVLRFLRGVVPDPCPEADHFGNESDVQGKTNMIEVCPELGKRGNKFYKVVR